VDLYDEFLKGLDETPKQPVLEPLWSFQKDRRTISCLLRYHGPYGVEAQILSDGDLRVGRRFDTKELAVQWANLERDAWETGTEETV
jgi:hypothetical protein